MSRSGSIAALLGDPELRVQAVAPSGDCFYEAIGIALASVEEGVGEQEGETPTAALRRSVAEGKELFVVDKFANLHLAFLLIMYFSSDWWPRKLTRRCLTISWPSILRVCDLIGSDVQSQNHIF